MMWNWRDRNGEQANQDAGTSEVQALLRAMDGKPAEPGPFFSKRVMAAIEAREVELTKTVRAWAAIPGFALRLSAVAALLLVMASTWLWTGTRRQSVMSGGIFEDSATAAASTSQDDVFPIPSEEAR